MSFSIPFSLEEWQNQKIDTVRYENWLKEDLFLHMKRKKITAKSKGLHSYIHSLKNEVAEYKQALTSEKLKVQSSNEPSIDCISFIEPNQCLKDWLKKGLIRKVTPSICNQCKALQQEERQRQKINKRKSRKLNNRTTSTLYKKNAKIHCLGMNKMIDPEKAKVMCQRCKRRTYTTWVDCQKEQLIIMKQRPT